MDSQAWTRLTNDQEQELDCLEFDEPEVGQFIQHQSQQCGYTGDWSVDAAPPVWDRWAEGWVRHQPGQGSGHQEPEQGRSSSWRSHDQPEQGTSSSWRSHGQPEQGTSSSWRSHGQAEQGRSSSWWCNEPEQVQSLSKGSQGTQRLSLERPSGNTGMIGHQRMNLPIGMMTNGKIGGAMLIGKIGMKARMRATLGG